MPSSTQTNPSEAVREADVVILCVPIEAMARSGERNSATRSSPPRSSPMSAASRAASTATSRRCSRTARCGSAAIPWPAASRPASAAARADLFEGATVILTPTRHTHRDAKHRAEKFWTCARRARLTELSPEKHDEMVAAVSHIPHLMPPALVNHAVEHGDLESRRGRLPRHHARGRRLRRNSGPRSSSPTPRPSGCRTA